MCSQDEGSAQRFDFSLSRAFDEGFGLWAGNRIPLLSFRTGLRPTAVKTHEQMNRGIQELTRNWQKQEAQNSRNYENNNKGRQIKKKVHLRKRGNKTQKTEIRK